MCMVSHNMEQNQCHGLLCFFRGVFFFMVISSWSFLMFFSRDLFSRGLFCGLCCLFMVSLLHGLWPHLFAKVGPS